MGIGPKVDFYGFLWILWAVRVGVCREQGRDVG